MSLIIVLQNISDLKERSDYRYTVLIGDGTPERSKTLETGIVRDHFRPWGWARLVQRFLDQRVPDSMTPARSPDAHLGASHE